MRMVLAAIAMLNAMQAVAETPLASVAADRCLGVLISGAAWNTDGFHAAESSETGEYMADAAGQLWVSPDGGTLLAVDDSGAGAQLRFCAVAQLPYPAAEADDLPDFGGVELRALAERLGLEPVEECWGLEVLGTTSWWIGGKVADSGEKFAAYLTRNSASVELFAYQPVGNILRDCVPLKPGGSQ